MKTSTSQPLFPHPFAREQLVVAEKLFLVATNRLYQYTAGYSVQILFTLDCNMAAVGIVGLAIGSAVNLRTVLLSVRQRYEHFLDNMKEFDDIVENLERIEKNLEEIKQKMNSRCRQDGGHIDRQLETVNKRLVCSREIVTKLGKGPLQVHSGASRACLSGGCLRITNANRIHDKLNKVSANIRDIDGLLDRVELLVSMSELSRRGSAEGVHRHRRVCNVPMLTHQEVLDFDGKNEDGDLTPEAQLKLHVLDKQSDKVVAAAGDASSTPHAKVQSVRGMAGVGKTVALKGLGWNEEVRHAFEQVHYITLGHDATDDAVVAELARIVEISGGERQSRMVRGCKNVSEAVLHTRDWLHDRKCLFLVDDVWKTDGNNFGYLHALRELLSTSQGSRMAITTRDTNIAGEAGQVVEFGSRGAVTSRKIFLRYFGSDALDETSVEGHAVEVHAAESIDKILSICKGVPLVLGVAGRGARALKEEGLSAEDALTEYADILNRQQLNVLEESPPGYGKQDGSLTLRAAMEISLEHLNSRCKSAGIPNGMCIGEMYRSLSVLKAQAWAPLSMLSKLWNVSPRDARRIAGKLSAMSLAIYTEQTYKAIRSNEERREGGLKIHDLQLEYCRRSCKELSRWHGRLLDGYLEATAEETRMQGSGADGSDDGAEDAMLDVEPRAWWSANVAEDGYVHENVGWHLVRAGKRDELRGLLVDARWIKLRLVIGGIVALESDFAELVRMEDGADVSGEGLATELIHSEFEAILNALRCSWQYVVHNERELGVQVGGRLFDVKENNAAARKLVESAIRNSERPFAEARYGYLPDARSGQVNEVYLRGRCFSLSYSSCGKYIAAAVEEDVDVVESDTLAEKMRFKGHAELVSSVCFIPESLKIVSGSWDGTVRVWDLSKPEDDALTLKGDNSRVLSVCASADGSRVASASEDGTVRLWKLQKEASEGEETRRRSKWMRLLCCSADDANGTEEADDAAHRCQVLRGHTDWVGCVCFSPDGALLASASHDGTVRLWNGLTGEHTGVTLEGHEGRVCCVVFSPDGERIASGAEDRKIRLWLADTGAPTGIVIEGHEWVNSVAFSADGGRIVSASDDKTVRVWSAESGAAIGAPLKGHTGWVNRAVFSPDGVRVASVSNDGTLRIWEPKRAGEVSAAREANSGYAYCVAFSADGTRVAVGHDDEAICIWDTQSGRAVGGTLEGHADFVTCFAFSPDGALLASGSIDRTVRLWNVRTGAAVGGALEGHNSWMYKVSFSADGTKLLSRSDDDCRCLWSVPSGALLWKSHRSKEDGANVLSDEEALRAVEAIESQSGPDASHETALVYYDWKESAVKMKRNEGDVRLATLPELPLFADEPWMHIAYRNEFVAVLSDGRPVCLTLHV